MRYLLRSILFIVFLCDPMALALHCSPEAGTNINAADCVMALRSAFTYHREPSAAEIAEERLFYNRDHATSELQAMPRAGVFGTCAITISLSPLMALGSIKQLKEDAVYLISGCVGAHGTGGIHHAHLFYFRVMHHRIVAAARATHQRQLTSGIPANVPIPRPKPKGGAAPSV